jgi:hypothetical protein
MDRGTDDAALGTTLLTSIAKQMMTRSQVGVDGKSLPVRRTSAHRFRTVGFEINVRKYQAIEQNSEKPSRWGQVAKSGHQVVQIKDAQTNKFVAVVVDGDVKVYGRR